MPRDREHDPVGPLEGQGSEKGMEPGLCTVVSAHWFSINYFRWLALESPPRLVWTERRHKLTLASWGFPDKIQTNESSHIQIPLWGSNHCLFIQFLLQNPLFGSMWINLMSSQVMTYPNVWTMRRIFCFCSDLIPIPFHCWQLSSSMRKILLWIIVEPAVQWNHIVYNSHSLTDLISINR